MSADSADRAERVSVLQDDLEAGNADGVAQDIAAILHEFAGVVMSSSAIQLYDKVFAALRKHADEG